MHPIRLTWFVCVAVLTASGCSSNAPAKISGQITYHNASLKGGTVIFHTEDKGSYSATLNEDGTYTVVDVPPGDVTVTVDTEDLNPNKPKQAYPGGAVVEAMTKERLAAERKAGFGPPPPEQMAARYVKIPPRYADLKQSPLHVSITPGKQTHNFELTD